MNSNSLTIRDENGIMKGKVTGHLAARLISQAKGHWRQYNTTSESKSCFELTEDCLYTVENNFGSLVIYLWNKDILVPDNV